MTKVEFAELTNKSPAQVRKLCDKGTFSVPGFGTFRAVKTGHGKTAPIDIRKVDDEIYTSETLSAGAENSAAMQKLRQARMAVDIQLRQQQLASRQELWEQQILSALTKSMLGALEPLREAFRKCQLNTTQTELINSALNESLLRVEKLLTTFAPPPMNSRSSTSKKPSR